MGGLSRQVLLQATLNPSLSLVHSLTHSLTHSPTLTQFSVRYKVNVAADDTMKKYDFLRTDIQFCDSVMCDRATFGCARCLYNIFIA